CARGDGYYFFDYW
nr:immunoglobulin heavy chain junction region [Mus musculus]